jgi:hypothetical protein
VTMCTCVAAEHSEVSGRCVVAGWVLPLRPLLAAPLLTPVVAWLWVAQEEAGGQLQWQGSSFKGFYHGKVCNCGYRGIPVVI